MGKQRQRISEEENKVIEEFARLMVEGRLEEARELIPKSRILTKRFSENRKPPVLTKKELEEVREALRKNY